MRTRRSLAAVAVLAAVLVQATGASAAAPSNDTIGGAVSVGAIPFSDSVDTSEATTDAEDEALNAQCGAPATDASVWYTLEGTGGELLVDVSGSDYSAGVLIGSGSPGDLVIVSCGPGASGFFAETGVTYFILAIDDQLDGAGNGGQLSISIDVPPPPPVIELTADKTGTFDPKTGNATVSGTATCTGEGVEFASLDGNLSQRAGRVIIRGFFFTELVCDGDTHPWTAEVQADNGLFKGGNATLQAFAFACDAFSCGEGSIEQTVKLKAGK
ncbi:MAG: hypothetical protein ACRDJ1_01695 [Actinomycetota bacterium]